MLPLRGIGIGILKLQTGEHEQHEMLPTLEAQVLRECGEMLEEGITPREGGSQQGASLIKQLQHRVEQEGEDILFSDSSVCDRYCVPWPKLCSK